MESYKSEKQTINAPVGAIYYSLTHLSTLIERLGDKMADLPENVRLQLQQVTITDEGIAINSPMGAVQLVPDERNCVENSRVAYVAAQSPLKFSLQVDLRPVDDNVTEAEAQLNVELPFFLRGMVERPLRDGAAKMGQVLAGLPYAPSERRVDGSDIV